MAFLLVAVKMNFAIKTKIAGRVVNLLSFE
jgi:hypothetical protein